MIVLKKCLKFKKCYKEQLIQLNLILKQLNQMLFIKISNYRNNQLLLNIQLNIQIELKNLQKKSDEKNLIKFYDIIEKMESQILDQIIIVVVHDIRLVEILLIVLLPELVLFSLLMLSIRFGIHNLLLNVYKNHIIIKCIVFMINFNNRYYIIYIYILSIFLSLFKKLYLFIKNLIKSIYF